MDQQVHAILATDKVHTVPQRVLDCGLGLERGGVYGSLLFTCFVKSI